MVGVWEEVFSLPSETSVHPTVLLRVLFQFSGLSRVEEGAASIILLLNPRAVAYVLWAPLVAPGEAPGLR